MSVVMAVCLSVGLALYFSQAPIALAASVNELTKTIVADENDFTYEKVGDYTVVTGLSESFVSEYTSYTGSGSEGDQITYNVRLDIPERLQNEQDGIPAGTKIDYVEEGAFAGNYVESGAVGSKKITFRITDVHTPESVYWQSKTIADGGLFNLANDVTEEQIASLDNKSVTDGNNETDENKKIWAKMLSANDGVTATVYDINVDNLPANFIVPSPMWHDKDNNGKMDDGELFANVELLVDEQIYGSASSGKSRGSNLRNMVISSGVTRFFSPYVKDKAIKIEDTFRSNNSDRSAMTGLHFATGRTTVLSIYGLAFQRYTGLQTITLSAGVLLADGVRAFQQDENVAVMNIASESNSNVPSFYVKGNNGAIYTGDYRYSYYDTAGYRKYLVWDYVTRYNKDLGDSDFQNNTKENGGYKADAAVSQPSAAALTSNSQLSPDSGISTIATGDGIDIPEGSIVFDANTGEAPEDKNFTEYDGTVVYVKSLNDLVTKTDGGFSFKSTTTNTSYTKYNSSNRKYIFDGVTYGGYFNIANDSVLTINYNGVFNASVYAVRDNNSAGTTIIKYSYTDKDNVPQTGQTEKLPGRNGSDTNPNYLSISNVKDSVDLTMSVSGDIGIFAIVLTPITDTPEPPQNGITVDRSEITFDLATDSAKTETLTLSTTGEATLDNFEWDILNSESESVKGSNYFDIPDTLQSGNTVTVKLNADTPPEAGDYTLTFTANSTYTASVTIHVNDSTPANIEIKSEDIESGGLASYYVGQTPDSINFTAEVTGKDGKTISEYKNITWNVEESGESGTLNPTKGQSTAFKADTSNKLDKITITIKAAILGNAEITDLFTFDLEVKEAPKENFAWGGEAYDGGIGVPDYSVVIDFGTRDFNFGLELGNYQEKFSVINITSTSINEYVEGIVTVNTSTATNSLGDVAVKINQKSPARNITYKGYYDPSKTGNIKLTVSDKFSIKAYIGHTPSCEAVFSSGEKDTTVKVANENNIKNDNEEYFTGLNNGLLQLDNLAAGTYTIESSSTVHIYAIVITPATVPDSIEADKTELTLAIPKAEETTSGSVLITAVGDAAAALQGATDSNITIATPHEGITATLGEYAEDTATRPINIAVAPEAQEGEYTLTFAIESKYSVEVNIKVVDPDKPTELVLNRTFITMEAGRATEFSAELLFAYSEAPENLSELLEKISWTIADGSSAPEWLTGQEVKDNRSIIILTPAAEGTYTLTATYSYNGCNLTAECKVVVTKGVDRILDTEAPAYNVTDQYVAYQKLVYVPPQLKDGNSGTLTEFTFLYTETTTIGNSAFAASHIETIRIPDRISTIEEYAFRYSSLKTVYLPSNATYGNAVFGEFKDFAINKEDGNMEGSGFKTAYKNADFLLIAPSYQIYDSLLATDDNPAKGKLTDRNTTKQTDGIDKAGTTGIKYDYRSKLTYEVEIVIGDKSVTVLYNQMDGTNLYVKNGNTFEKKTWSAVLSGLRVTGSVYYGSTEITEGNIENFITGNLADVTYSVGTANSYGLYTNTSTVKFDSWTNGSSEPSAPTTGTADYTPNENRLPASITLAADGTGEQENSGAIAVPGFQPVGDQIPVGESKNPELTVMFDFAGYPYSRIFEGYDPDTMEASYEYKGIGSEHSVNGGAKKLTENAPYPYDAGTYTITITLKNNVAAAAALASDGNEYWEGTYNGLPVTNNDVAEKVYTINIQKRSVPMPGDRQVLHTEATGAEVAVFENNAFYEVVKYSDKITMDSDGEKQIRDLTPLKDVPYQRGSYWVALKLIDEYNLQWVGESNEIIDGEDTEYYKPVGDTNVDVNDNGNFVTCKLIISDSPSMPLLSFVTDENIGTASGSTFTATYRNKEYALSDIFTGYHSYSVNATITSYTEIGAEEAATVIPNSILNAGTYTVKFKPAENYAWQVGTRGCGYAVTAGDINNEYTATIIIEPKTLATPPEQIQFIGSSNIEYAPAPDGTWTVVGYRSGSSGVFGSVSFKKGEYEVELKLTDENNYKWADPVDNEENAAYTITKLDVRNTDELGLDNPVSKDNPLTYTGSVLSSADAIDYDSVITLENRSVYKYSYQTYDASGYKTVTQTAPADSMPASVLNAGEYTIQFKLPTLANSANSYWWNAKATTNNGGETDPEKPDDESANKYYGMRYADLTVNKREITRVYKGMVIETDISAAVKNPTAPLPSQYLFSAYTATYKANGGGATVNESGIPNNIGTYIVTLTLTEAGYRNYYFRGTTQSESGAAGDEAKYYPKSITVTLNVGVKTTAAPYVNQALTYDGGAKTIEEIITIPVESESAIAAEDRGKIISYTKPGSEEKEGTAPTEIKEAGVYVLEYKIASSATSIWSTAVPSDYESFNKLTIDPDDETYRTLHVQVTVKQATLEVTLSADGKIYDGNTTATVTGTVTGKPYNTDDVTVEKVVASFADENAGENKSITVDSVTLGGAQGYNYTADYEASAATLKANIQQAQITLGGEHSDTKTYDGDVYSKDVTSGSGITVSTNNSLSETVTVHIATKEATAKTYGKGDLTLSYSGYNTTNYTITDNVTYSVKIEKATITVSGTYEASKPYDGKEYSQKITAATAEENGLTVGTTDSTFEITVSSAEVNVGEYTKANSKVSVTYKYDKTNYNAPVDTATYKLTITPKALSASDITWGETTFEYDGDSKAPTAEIEGAGETITLDVDVSGEDVTDGKAINANTEGNTYTATAKLPADKTGNYTLSGNCTKEFTITPQEVNVEWTDLEIPYDGTSKAPTATAKDKKGTSVELTVEVTESAHIEVGEYNATAETTDTNYTLNPSTVSTTFEIVACEIELSEEEKSVIESYITQTKEYDGNKNVQIKGSGHSLTRNGEQITYTLSAEYNSKDVSTATTISVTLTLADKTDTYKFKASKSGVVYTIKGDNTIGWDITTGVSITAKPLTVEFSGLTKTFTGSELSPTATATTGVGAETVTLGVNITEGSAPDYTGKLTGDKAINAGAYKATAEITGVSSDTEKDNYTLQSNEAKFTIGKAKATAEWSATGVGTIDEHSQITYDGEEHTVSLKLSVGSYSVTLTPDVQTCKDAGEHTFTATDKSGNFTENSWSLTINVDKATLKVASATVTPKPYDGKTNVEAGKITFTFTGYQGSDDERVVYAESYKAIYASANAATSVTVNVTEITLGGSAKDNYTVDLENLPSISGMINKATLGVEVTENEHVYDGNAKSATVTLTGVNGIALTMSGANGFTVEYQQGGEPVESPTDVGVYDIVITLKGTAATNYEPVTDSYKLTITEAEITAIEWYKGTKGNELKSSKTYSGTTKVLAYGTCGSDEVVLTVTNDSGTDEYKNVDSYTFTATPDSNHKLAAGVDNTFELQVTPKSITITGSLTATKTYDSTTKVVGGIDASKASLNGTVVGDTVNIASVEGEYTSPDRGQYITLHITSVTLNGSDADNYIVGEFTQRSGTSVITPARITITVDGGELSIEKIKQGLSLELQTALDNYLIYSGSTHKTIAITNSPLSRVPKVDKDNKPTTGNLEDGKGGVGLGGTHPYFYLPLTSLEQYGMKISNFYGGIGEDIGDGAIITIMFATSAGDAGTYKIKNTDHNRVLYLEANLANEDTLLPTGGADADRLRGNYSNSDGGFGDTAGSWNYADFKNITSFEIEIAKLEVELKWKHDIVASKPLDDYKDTHVFSGENIFGEYIVTYTGADGAEDTFNTGNVGSIALENGGNEILNAGEYTIVATAGSGFGNYSIKAGTDKLTVTITKYVITQEELDSSLAEAWRNSVGGSLATGTYDVGAEGATVSKTGQNAFAWLRDGKIAEVMLSNSSFVRIETRSRTTYYGFTVESYTNNKQVEKQYSYEATATLTLNDNFAWAQSYNAPTHHKSAAITDGKLVVTKEWYLVKLENGVTDDIKVNSKDLVPDDGFDWLFGAEAVNITEPVLMHEEAKDGSTYTLELTRIPDGTIPEGVTTKWEEIPYGNNDISKYLNSATPTGFYSLILHIAACNVAGKAYPATEIRYVVGVGKATIGDITVEDYSDTYNGGLIMPDDFSAITDSIDPAAIREGKEIWSDAAYNSYYAFDEGNIRFSTPETGTYYTLATFASAPNAPKDVKLKAELVEGMDYNKFVEDAYTVQFRFAAPNYAAKTGSFKVTVLQKELTLSLSSSSDDVTVDVNKVSWIYGTKAAGKLSLNFTGNVGSDEIDIRYAYYAASDTEYATPLGSGSTREGATNQIPQNAGSYKWRFTFDRWNSSENKNNNYKIKAPNGKLVETSGGVKYLKPCYVVDLEIKQAEKDLTDYGTDFGNVRTLPYSGNEQHYLTEAENGRGLTGHHKDGDDFTDVKYISDGNYDYHTAYIEINNVNYKWKEGLTVDENGWLEVHLIIEPAKLNVTWTMGGKAVNSSYTYDGAEHTVTATLTWTGSPYTQDFKFKDVKHSYTFEATLPKPETHNFVWADGATTSINVDVNAFTITEEVIKNAVNVTTSKTYDGTKTAQFVLNSINGQHGERIVLTVSAAYNDENVLTADTITVTVALAENNVNKNYELAIDSYTVNGNITPKPLNAANIVGMEIADKVYDQQVDVPEANITEGTLNGIVGETVNYNIVSARYDNQGAAGTRNVTIVIVLDSAPNYTLEDDTLTVEANIERAKVTVTVDGEFFYNGTDQYGDLLNSLVFENRQTEVLPIGRWCTPTAIEFIGANTYSLTLTINSRGGSNYTFDNGTESITLTVIMNKAVLTEDDIEVNAESLNVTYSGTSHGVEYTVPEYVSGVTVTYDGVSGEPINADTYEATIVIAGTSNYDGVTKIVTLTIAPYKVDAANISGTVVQSKAYDGTMLATLTQNGVLRGVGSETVDFTVKSAVYDGKDVGLHTVTMTIELNNSNYVLTNTVHTISGQQISRMGVNARNITGMSVADKVYDATNTAKVTGGTLAGANGETVEFNVIDANYNNANAGSNKPVTVTIEIDNGNYRLDGNTKELYGNILRAQVKVEYSGRRTYVYTGSSLWDTVRGNLTATVTNSTVSLPVITYKVNGAEIENNALTDVGIYTITASISNRNYELIGATGGVVATVEITGKIIERIEWTGDAVCTYNGKDITAPTAKAVLVSGEEIELNVIGSVGKDVGTYTFTVETLSDYIYQSGLQMSFTVTVDPARVTIGKAVQRVVYSGTAYPIPEVELTWSEGTLQKGVDYTVTGTSGATNVGTYVYTVKLNSSNYTFRRGSTTTATLYIEAATVSIGEIAHVTYDGNAHTPELHLSWKGGDLTADAYTVSGDAAVNAGSHTFTVTLKSGNLRFSTGNDTRVELVIDKLTLEKPAADEGEYVYNGSEHTYKIAQNDNYTVSNATRTNAGTQTVKVSLNDKRNTVWSDGTTQDVRYTFTVNKAQVTIDPVADVTVKYDGASHGVTVHVSDSTVPVIVTYNGYSVEPINAGTYSVAVTVPETENFEGATLDGITLRITKAVVTVKWSSQSVFTENGEVQTPYLGVDGADESVVKVTYKSGSETLTGAPAEVGEYTVCVEAVSDNYELDGKAEMTFSIKAASAEPQEPVTPEQPNEPEEPADSGNFDAVWYVMIAISAIALIFAVVSTVIYIKRSRV